MINFDYIIKENIKMHNPNWPQIPYHLHILLIIRSSGSGKTNLLFNVSHQPDTDQIYFYAKDPYETKFQLIINKRESAGINNLNGSKAIIEYSNDVEEIQIKSNTIQIKNAKY